nr:PREDICTED: 26 kDa secreted antigen-like [Bemisia tabaci]
MLAGEEWLRSRGLLWVLCGLLAISFAGARTNLAGKIKAGLVRHGIIPEIMMKSPKFHAYVAFGKKYSARFGNLIPIEAVGNRPTTMKWKTKFRENAVYTLIAMDLDAIPKAHRWDETEFERLLWLVVNIPASRDVNVTMGKTLAPYIPPTLDPIKGEDHRILFIIFEQPGGNMNFTFPVLDAKPDDPRRTEFNVHKFVDEHKLDLPVATNFYTTREGLLEAEKAAAKKKPKMTLNDTEGVKDVKDVKDVKGETTTIVYLDVTAERFNPHEEEEDEMEIEVEY